MTIADDWYVKQTIKHRNIIAPQRTQYKKKLVSAFFLICSCYSRNNLTHFKPGVLFMGHRQTE